MKDREINPKEIRSSWGNEKKAFNQAPKRPRPNEMQIRKTIALIQDKLRKPAIEKPANAAVKEGYTEAVAILAEHRDTYAGIEALTSVQARSIAGLAVDYLRGETSQKMLTGVPLR